MIYTDNTKKALKLMFEKHKNQFDKSEIPYVYHPLHVAESMKTEETTIIALLHDVIEDTKTTFEELKEYGFSDVVIDNIKLLTHVEGEDYFDYIKRISTSELAIIVKLADLNHNMDLTRLNEVKSEDLLRYEKYKKSYDYLREKLNQIEKNHEK